MSNINQKLNNYLGNIKALTGTSSDGKNDYVHPSLRNMGSVSIVLVREIIAPAIFRNQDAEITSINLEELGVNVVRATPTKFKFKERANGLRLLRKYGVGGAYPQNRQSVSDKSPFGEIFDMNSFVFGDSVNRGNSVLPIKASVCYSDALSLTPYMNCVDHTFHNRAGEDGSLFDVAKKENSSALFERHFVVPGTLMVQVLTSVGKTLPFEGLEHLMLSIGLSGSYGGQTSVIGTNVATHLVGIYASNFEQPETSPYILASKVQNETNVKSAVEKLHEIIAPKHQVVIDSAEAEEWRQSLVEEVNSDSDRIKKSYQGSKQAMNELFSQWFTGKAA